MKNKIYPGFTLNPVYLSIYPKCEWKKLEVALMLKILTPKKLFCVNIYLFFGVNNKSWIIMPKMGQEALRVIHVMVLMIIKIWSRPFYLMIG